MLSFSKILSNWHKSSVFISAYVLFSYDSSCAFLTLFLFLSIKDSQCNLQSARLSVLFSISPSTLDLSFFVLSPFPTPEFSITPSDLGLQFLEYFSFFHPLAAQQILPESHLLKWNRSTFWCATLWIRIKLQVKNQRKTKQNILQTTIHFANNNF